MKVNHITTEDLPKIIEGLNNKVAWENPSIFLEPEISRGIIDNDLIFNQMYKIDK